MCSKFQEIVMDNQSWLSALQAWECSLLTSTSVMGLR